MAYAAFQQADLNQDGKLSLAEFSNFLGKIILTSSIYNLFSLLFCSGQNVGGGASYGSSSYGYGAGAGAGYGGSSSYESSSFSNGGGYGAGAGAGFGGSSYESSYSSGGYGAGAGAGAGYGGSSYESSSFSSGGGYGAGASFGGSSTQVQQYATDAQGLFIDNNPQVITRPAAGGVQTYQQNIKVRFLQPPPLPPPGVSHLLFLFCITFNTLNILATHHQRSSSTSTTTTTTPSYSSTSSIAPNTPTTRSP